MSTSLYDLTVPVFVRGFGNLSAILDKGRDYADQQGIDRAQLLQARLYPDMAPLTAQIQRASDTAKGTVVRVGGVPNLVLEDNETSFEDLQARIAATVAFLRGDGRPRGRRSGAADAEPVDDLHRAQLCAAVRPAQLLLPRDHRLCAAAA